MVEYLILYEILFAILNVVTGPKNLKTNSWIAREAKAVTYRPLSVLWLLMAWYYNDQIRYLKN